MEEKKMDPGHRITLLQRNSGIIKGVQDVRSFDETEILLMTTCGNLIIKGEKLHVRQLDLEKGEVEVEGRVDNLTYMSKNIEKDRRSVLKKMFG